LQTATPLTGQAEERRQHVPPKETHQETTMDDRHNTDVDYVARARNLIARAARGVEHLEDMAGLAVCRLTALGERMAQIEEQVQSSDPDAVDAGLLSAATACREVEILLRYLDSVQWNSLLVAANGKDRARSPAPLCGVASGGSPDMRCA
jgi:hypothetical protein